MPTVQSFHGNFRYIYQISFGITTVRPLLNKKLFPLFGHLLKVALQCGVNVSEYSPIGSMVKD